LSGVFFVGTLWIEKIDYAKSPTSEYEKFFI